MLNWCCGLIWSTVHDYDFCFLHLSENSLCFRTANVVCSFVKPTQNKVYLILSYLIEWDTSRSSAGRILRIWQRRLRPGNAILLFVHSLHWRHNDHDGVSNHQPHGCLLKLLFRRRSKKTSKLRVTGLCVGNSPGPVNSPHKGPVTRKMFSFDDVIMEDVSCAIFQGD